jgi:hypothetical protein
VRKKAAGVCSQFHIDRSSPLRKKIVKVKVSRVAFLVCFQQLITEPTASQGMRDDLTELFDTLINNGLIKTMCQRPMSLQQTL